MARIKRKAILARARRGAAKPDPARAAFAPIEQAAAAALCRRLADGESLQAICRDPSMPGLEAVRRALDADPAFAALYAKARRHQADSLIDAAIDTAHEALDHDNAAAVRVKIDAMLKLAAQLGARLGELTPVSGDGELAAAIAAARARLTRFRQPRSPAKQED